MHAITLAVSQLVERHLPVADTSVKETMRVLTFLTKQDQVSCVSLESSSGPILALGENELTVNGIRPAELQMSKHRSVLQLITWWLNEEGLYFHIERMVYIKDPTNVHGGRAGRCLQPT